VTIADASTGCFRFRPRERQVFGSLSGNGDPAVVGQHSVANVEAADEGATIWRQSVRHPIGTAVPDSREAAKSAAATFRTSSRST
jgi:hypothetical protein